MNTYTNSTTRSRTSAAAREEKKSVSEQGQKSETTSGRSESRKSEISRKRVAAEGEEGNSNDRTLLTAHQGQEHDDSTQLVMNLK